jgi:hypothetical protein
MRCSREPSHVLSHRFEVTFAADVLSGSRCRPDELESSRTSQIRTCFDHWIRRLRLIQTPKAIDNQLLDFVLAICYRDLAPVSRWLQSSNRRNLWPSRSTHSLIHDHIARAAVLVVAPFGSARRTRRRRPPGSGFRSQPEAVESPLQKILHLATRLCRDLEPAHLRDFSGSVSRVSGHQGEKQCRLSRPSPSLAPLATQQPVAVPATTPPSTSLSWPEPVSRRFTTTSLPSASRATSPSQFRLGTCIKVVIQAQSQLDEIASIPLLIATIVRPVRPATADLRADSS